MKPLIHLSLYKDLDYKRPTELSKTEKGMNSKIEINEF